MSRLTVLALLCALTTCTTVSAQTQTRFLGAVEVPFPTFMNVFNHSSTETSPLRMFSILVSSFNSERSTYDHTYSLMYPGEHITGDVGDISLIPVRTVFNFLYGPKESKQMPRAVLGYDAIAHFDGTTIFGKTRGAVYVSDVSDINFPATHDIASEFGSGVWMYHTGVWKLVDGNNREDLLACRIQIEDDQIRFAELVWLNHPLQGISTNWEIRVLKDAACDGNMAEARLQAGGDSYDVIYAVGRYTQRLTFFWTTALNGQWNIADNVQAGVVEQGREYHDVITGDFNNDGRIDVLVTVGANVGGSVEIFEIPADFTAEAGYIKHVIATGFTSRHNDAAGRSPGIARAFYPDTNHARKPWIYVAGADDGRAYILVPQLEAPTEWGYDLVTVADHGSGEHVGGITTADVDGDGYQELFVSVQSRSRLEVYTFKP